MGNAESTLMRLAGALAEPCAQCCHDVSKIWEEDFTCDSGCGETCCKCHIESHHPDDDSDGADEENAA